MGEGKGWISIYRSIQEHWLWQEKPYDKAHAWIDLLLSANHKENKVLLGNELILIEAGSFITSQSKLMSRWGWGNTKVRNFLKLLANDGMIKCSGENYTLIKIINYEMYQKQTDASQVVPMDSENQQTGDKLVTNRKQTGDKLRANTNNNDNNDNNDNKNICPNSIEFRLASYLFKYIKRNNEKAKEPNMQKWSKQFDYILRIDKRDIEEVKNVIKWCQNDSFWLKNILSPDKLRKQYDRLLISMKDPKPKEKRQDNFNDYTQRQYDYDDLERKLLGWDKEGE
jgi:DNA replication protein DnaD